GPEGIGFTGAIDAYTQLATATGGSFVFVPEVNNNAEGVVKYQAAAENILAASIGPKLISATPGNVMRGATATVLIDAQNTNFLSNTTVTFDTGVTATSVSVVDPVTLAVTVQVAADAPLGFKNATATTNLGGGATETATGAAILNVIDAPSSPALSSANPPIVTPGQTVDVVVTGVGTAFAAGTTTASFGAGVTVNSVTVTSPTTATVNVTVDPGASIGFRTVSLTTGAETASGSSTGFFRVDAVAPPVPTVTTIVPDNSAPATTFPISLTVTNATLDPGGTTVEFSGSGVSVSGVTVCGNTVVGTVTIAPTATPGFRDVIVRSPGSGTAASLGGFLVDGSATTASDDDDCGSCRVVEDAPARWHVLAGLIAAAAAAGFVGRRTAQRRAN
ncbi:MAG TPA: hypothetical protein VEI02_00385, partial [Planctomycetota bacterium]|nr:hypothetical protein [Planctomycetota bacterium]